MTKINRRPSLQAAFTLAAILSTSRPAIAQTATGRFSGKLITESGQPLPGATATYRRGQAIVVTRNRHMAPAPGEPALQGSVTTRADGTFAASAITAGTYSLCLDNPPAPYVDPCEWNLGPNTFVIAQGSVTAIKPITIISGVRVHFLITDPQGALPSGSRLEPHAHVGVVTPNHIFRPAIVGSRVSNVVDAMITIPHNQPVTTWVYSKSLKFTDLTGAPAKSSAVAVAPGATDHNIPLSVSK